MKKKLISIAWALLMLLPITAYANDTHTSVPNSGTANIRTKSYTRTSDAATVQMQVNQNGWLEMDFGSTANCADSSGICTTTTAGQVFDERTTSGVSNAITVNGSSLANFLAISCECDDSDVDFYIRPVYVHYNAVAKDNYGAIINFDNTIGATGSVLEAGFRQTDLKIIEVLGAKEIKFSLTVNAGSAPRVSCWFARL